ncbi:amidohydrolase family protein [Nocardioides soli]|uniref:5-methylthioadenosine/S-adenosylhomocysteine deaminase n=1 Tax=Nocardioides soli TaxID=1036020 RepID=A0A7W4VRW8_9ACTN|nr:amidohydrolase family protein [Nocardioides soli]MBB3040661.1 5-methylthioadenosine/S-adenosylhomocysteine deaminase [Nocardioides soli]
MRTLILGNPVVALGDPALGDTDLIEDGAVIVQDEAIVEVGPRELLEQHGPFDQVLGGPDSIVMPGLINGHYHSELSVGPGHYQYIFEQANVHVHGGYGPALEHDLYLIAQHSIAAMIRGGQTSAVDMYYGRPSVPHFGTEPVLRAYADSGFRVAFGLVSRDQHVYAHEADDCFLKRLPPALAAEVRASPMGYAWPLDEVFATYDHLARTWDGYDGRIRTVLAPDWTPACSDELYQRCRRLADEYDTGITSHVLETRAEMHFSHQRYGMSALERLDRLGVLGPDMVCAHFVWVTDDELRIFADSGAVASNNPGSNLRLSAGVARIRDIMAAGGRVMFGTDGISFNDDEDMFTEIRLGSYLYRDPRDFEHVRADSAALLRSAGENGARAIRQEGRVGRLAPGLLADLLILDRTRITSPAGRYDDTPFLDLLVDRAQRHDLRSVMIHGRLVMSDRVLTTIDEAHLRSELEEALRHRVYRPDPTTRRHQELGHLVSGVLPDIYRPAYEREVMPAAVFNARAVPRG